eukprot:403373560
MGAPKLIEIYNDPNLGYIDSDVVIIPQNNDIKYFFTQVNDRYVIPMLQNGINVKQPIELTNRAIHIPDSNKTYKYLIGDTSLQIQFPNCEYNQECVDTVFNYNVLTSDLKSLPSAFKFAPSSRKLYVSSLDLYDAGLYDLIFKCNVQDGFSNNQTFSVKIEWDGRDLNPKLYMSQKSYNYAPQFYEKPRDIVIIAGRPAALTLPDYYDPNPFDIVTVKFETPEKYKQYFRMQNSNTIVFDAGFPELGDQYLIITLRDNNPTNPKETKYLIKATFLQNNNFQMENPDVNNVSLNNSTQTIYAFANYKYQLNLNLSVLQQSTTDIFIIGQGIVECSIDRSQRVHKSQNQSISGIRVQNASPDQSLRQ